MVCCGSSHPTGFPSYVHNHTIYYHKWGLTVTLPSFIVLTKGLRRLTQLRTTTSDNMATKHSRVCALLHFPLILSTLRCVSSLYVCRNMRIGNWCNFYCVMTMLIKLSVCYNCFTTPNLPSSGLETFIMAIIGWQRLVGMMRHLMGQDALLKISIQTLSSIHYNFWLVSFFLMGINHR